MNKHLPLIVQIFILFFVSSCSDESVDEDIKNVFDCEFEDNAEFVGICLNGSTRASPGDELKYASKTTANFSEIIWEIESGSMEILDIENSIEDDNYKSIATIHFKEDFTGGSLKVLAIDINSNNFAEITDYVIELQN
ncbi:hypothetical protein [Winogradskyella flava]|uniref:Uncharacterized protein n=1 Tax=Winogradskyella flava TaxID=1884876 RepID=A0A842IND2_9FLAO|nr:hypothetical protein [Winogradskyella flava]MBC2844510.1 hypothetical protein [Winogradskyella flava]